MTKLVAQNIRSLARGCKCNEKQKATQFCILIKTSYHAHRPRRVRRIILVSRILIRESLSSHVNQREKRLFDESVESVESDGALSDFINWEIHRSYQILPIYQRFNEYNLAHTQKI
jgi:hypothetical protein